MWPASMASAVGTKTSFPYAATCAPLQQDVGKFKDEIVPLKIEVAVPMVLKLASLSLKDVGLIELNEAFASQALAVIRELGMDEETVNVNGGAIALGHPIGCSGARILTTLLHEMKRRKSHETRPYYGLATLCVGVGMGVSTLVEWLDWA